MSKATAKTSAKHLPPFSPQGRISDAVIAQVQAHLRSMTPAQAWHHMIKVGIIDKQGNRLETQWPAIDKTRRGAATLDCGRILPLSVSQPSCGRLMTAQHAAQIMEDELTKVCIMTGPSCLYSSEQGRSGHLQALLCLIPIRIRAIIMFGLPAPLFLDTIREIPYTVEIH